MDVIDRPFLALLNASQTAGVAGFAVLRFGS